MNVLAVPAPIALGTDCAESLHSLLRRILETYNVPSGNLITLLTAVSGEKVARLGAYKTPQELLGQGVLTKRLLIGLARLSGRDDLALTTFARLGSIIGHGRGLIAKSSRVCSDCLNPASGISYGMLAHQLQYVARCPLHHSPLNDRCLGCGWPFSMFLDPFRTKACPHCGDLFWTQRRDPFPLARFGAWAEQQMLNFVAFATCREEAAPDERWGEAFSTGMTRLTSSLESYSRAEKMFIREVAKRAQTRGALPSMNTLLRISSIQAVELVEFVRAPSESCSPRLLDIGEARVRLSRRRGRTRADWLSTKLVLERLLGLDEIVPLPSKSSLFAEFGLTPSGFWQHFPDLSVQYERERFRRRSLAKANRYKSAVAAARKLVREQQIRGESADIRRDGALVMLSTGATKNLAERALHAALASLDILKAARQEPELTGRA